MRYFPTGTVAVTACLVALMTGASADPGDPWAGAHYVNMGSSFAAGTGVAPPAPGGSSRCRQSDAGYAALLAAQLGLVLDDRSCAGARSEHLLGPWRELPPQIEAVRGETKLVTITVGGNDLNYVGNLMAAGCDEEVGFVFGGRNVPCFAQRPVSEADYAQLEGNLRETVRRIATTAPAARIIFVQYVTLLPDTLCDATPLSAEDAERLRALGARLAAVTAAAAGASGAGLLATDALSLAHTPCDPEPWSIGAGVTPDNAEGIAWHPNRQGHAAIAGRLRQMLATGT